MRRRLGGQLPYCPVPAWGGGISPTELFQYEKEQRSSSRGEKGDLRGKQNVLRHIPSQGEAETFPSLRSAGWASGMGISDAVSQREHGHQSRTDPGDFKSLTTFRKMQSYYYKRFYRVWSKPLILQVRNQRPEVDKFTKAA